MQHHGRRHFGKFSLCMQRNCLCRSFRSKIRPWCSIRRPRFPTRWVYFLTIRWRLRHIFDIFVLNFHVTLWAWTLTFLTLTVSCYIKLHTSDAHTTVEHPTGTIIRFWVMDDSIGSHFHHTEPSLCMRSITWPVYMGFPKTTCNNFWLWIVCSLYNFYEATMTTKVSWC